MPKKDSIEELRRIIAQYPGSGDSNVNALTIEHPVPYWLIDQIIKEIESLRSVAGAARAGGGSDIADIKQACGRSFSRE